MIVRLVAARVSTSRIRGVVVNFDLPLVAEDYKHRIDRTARAGQHGQRAVSLLSASEIVLLRQIQRVGAGAARTRGSSHVATEASR